MKGGAGTTRLGYSMKWSIGLISSPALVKMLPKLGYSGVCRFDHEKDMTDPFKGIEESVSYFSGVTNATKQVVSHRS